MLCYLCCLPRWAVWGQWCLETSTGKERRHLAHFLPEKLAEEATRECLERGAKGAKVVLVVVHLLGKIGEESSNEGVVVLQELIHYEKSLKTTSSLFSYIFLFQRYVNFFLGESVTTWYMVRYYIWGIDNVTVSENLSKDDSFLFCGFSIIGYYFQAFRESNKRLIRNFGFLNVER